jgi:hypothetical protein
VTTWTALDPTADLEFVPGGYYAVVAHIKATHTESDVRALAQKHGLTILDYAESGRPGLGPDPSNADYKYVAAMAQAQVSGSLPTSAPWPISVFDGSSVVSAWSAPPGSAAPAEPDVPAPSSAPPAKPLLPSVGAVAAGAAVGVAGASLWRAWRRRRRRT